MGVAGRAGERGTQEVAAFMAGEITFQQIHRSASCPPESDSWATRQDLPAWVAGTGLAPTGTDTGTGTGTGTGGRKEAE